MAETPIIYSADPRLFVFTSLSSGSSTIVTATSRLETILKAHKIPFTGIDVATDEKARMLWGRRAGKRKLPGLVRQGEVLADMEQVEEWNEYGEIKEQLSFEPKPAAAAQPKPIVAEPLTKSPTPPSSLPSRPSAPTPLSATERTISDAVLADTNLHPGTIMSSQQSNNMAMRSLADEAAARAKEIKMNKLKAMAGMSPEESKTQPVPAESTTAMDSKLEALKETLAQSLEPEKAGAPSESVDEKPVALVEPVTDSTEPPKILSDATTVHPITIDTTAAAGVETPDSTASPTTKENVLRVKFKGYDKEAPSTGVAKLSHAEGSKDETVSKEDETAKPADESGAGNSKAEAKETISQPEPTVTISEPVVEKVSEPLKEESKTEAKGEDKVKAEAEVHPSATDANETSDAPKTQEQKAADGEMATASVLD